LSSGLIDRSIDVAIARRRWNTQQVKEIGFLECKDSGLVVCTAIELSRSDVITIAASGWSCRTSGDKWPQSISIAI